jgi:hypothetical protein
MRKSIIYVFCLFCAIVFMSQGYSLEKELVEVQYRVADLSAQSLEICLANNQKLAEANARFQSQILALLWFNIGLGISFFAVALALLGADSPAASRIFSAVSLIIDFFVSRLRRK